MNRVYQRTKRHGFRYYPSPESFRFQYKRSTESILNRGLPMFQEFGELSLVHYDNVLFSCLLYFCRPRIWPGHQICKRLRDGFHNIQAIFCCKLAQPVLPLRKARTP